MTIVNYDWDEVEDNIVEEYDETGATVAEYTTEAGPFGDVLSQRRNGQDSFYHYDGQGSTLTLTDASADVTDTYAYSAFGEVTAQTGSTVNPFQFVGQRGYYHDDGIGDYYVRQRPLTAKGRWLARDILYMQLEVHACAYLYVRNRPTMLMDPTGQIAFSPVGDVFDIPLGHLCYKIPCNLLHWSPLLCSDPPSGGHICTCENTLTGVRSTLEDCNATLADAVKEAFLRPNNNVVLSKFYCSRTCGGTDYGLTCFDKVTRGPHKGKVRIGVCIPYNTSKCNLKSLIEHELLHVEDLLHYIDELGPDAIRMIDRDAFEERAYNRQCSILASQRCLSGDEARQWTLDCVTRLKGLSTGATGIFTIGRGCSSFNWELPA